MYGKIFESMYDGTIAANWKALITFQQMIVLSDQHGVCDIHPPALAKRTGIPLEIIEEGIAYLEKPDIYSRSQEHEGRRIVLLDDHRPWGWSIVNHKHYRDLSSTEDRREKDRLRKQKQRSVAKCPTDKPEDKQEDTSDHEECHDLSSMSRHTIVSVSVSSLDLFNLFYEAHPKKKAKKVALASWEKIDPELYQMIIDDVKNRSANCDEWIHGYAPHPATYLNQERWNDDLTEKKNETRQRFDKQKTGADIFADDLEHIRQNGHQF